MENTNLRIIRFREVSMLPTSEQYNQIKERARIEEEALSKFKPTHLVRYKLLQREILIEASQKRLVEILVAVSGLDPNETGRHWHAKLDSCQVLKVWENRSETVSVEVNCYGKLINLNLGHCDLMVNKVDADDYLKLLIDDGAGNMSVVTNDALIREAKSQQGKEGANKRHYNDRILKNEACQLYLKNKIKSKRQAAKKIDPLLREYCRKNQIRPLSSESGEETIYKWLLDLKK